MHAWTSTACCSSDAALAARFQKIIHKCGKHVVVVRPGRIVGPFVDFYPHPTRGMDTSQKTSSESKVAKLRGIAGIARDARETLRKSSEARGHRPKHPPFASSTPASSSCPTVAAEEG